MNRFISLPRFIPYGGSSRSRQKWSATALAQSSRSTAPWSGPPWETCCIDVGGLCPPTVSRYPCHSETSAAPRSAVSTRRSRSPRRPGGPPGSSRGQDRREAPVPDVLKIVMPMVDTSGGPTEVVHQAFAVNLCIKKEAIVRNRPLRLSIVGWGNPPAMRSDPV